ncbi:MAG: ATP-binding protein [Tindallia sp. MSAO_Bac2]|nr:MAG: ATP-binding protein [Tindallia sp. MSAO_Bac2]
MREYQVEFISDFKEADYYSVLLTTYIEKHYDHITAEESFNINFALRELLNNAVEHGNHNDPEKKVRCIVSGSENGITIIVKDEGDGFTIRDVQRQQPEQADLEIRKRGLWLLDKLGFTVEVEGNNVTAHYNWEVEK